MLVAWKLTQCVKTYHTCCIGNWQMYIYLPKINGVHYTGMYKLNSGTGELENWP